MNNRHTIVPVQYKSHCCEAIIPKIYRPLNAVRSVFKTVQYKNLLNTFKNSLMRCCNYLYNDSSARRARAGT
jgi:hypothetical protein